jgi:hypothetical protein
MRQLTSLAMFGYPLVPVKSPFRHAVLYRLSADRWRFF